ncbi:hypothetical protein LNO18_11070 [Klebsiella variicola subsp. variicola]|nr:hypothetical protein [Klebsiella variicola subsp. variicola]
MAIFLKSDSSPISSGANPVYLENDPAIIRGATLGLLDFSNEICYDSGTPVAAYANLLNLVSGGTNATNGPNSHTLETGMLKFTGAAENTNDYVLLPTAEFSLPTGCKRALASVAVKLPASGYGIPAANRSVNLVRETQQHGCSEYQFCYLGADQHVGKPAVSSGGNDGVSSCFRVGTISAPD